MDGIREARLKQLAFVHVPIVNIDRAKVFIAELIDKDLFFHLEDDPAEIINAQGYDLFTKEEAAVVRERIKELYSFDWSIQGHECPIGFALELLEDEEGLIS